MALKINTPSFFQHAVWLPLRAFMHICCSAKIEGLEHIKKINGNVIFASNHVTEIDPLLIVASLPFLSNKLPIIYVVMEKKEYGNIWNDWRKHLYGGEFFRMIGGYEAYKGLNNYRAALKNHLQAIEENQSVCIFPIGKRHKIDETNEARGGASFLAWETNLPIIPIHIKGVSKDTGIKDYFLRKPRLVITFGEPLYAADIFKESLEELKISDKRVYEEASIELMKAIARL